MPPHQDAGTTWILFTVLTVSCWGLYGVLLHKGQADMGDPDFGRYKAFLFVGVAYVLVAVLAPIALLVVRGASWELTTGGVLWSTLAGVVGAVGAFGVLLAFGAKGSPAVVMSVVFAGAPIVNAIVAITLARQWGVVRAPFVLGILLAALGGYLVSYYKPPPVHHAPPAEQADSRAGHEG